jgi:hypothetical protein
MQLVVYQWDESVTAATLPFFSYFVTEITVKIHILLQTLLRKEMGVKAELTGNENVQHTRVVTSTSIPRPRNPLPSKNFLPVGTESLANGRLSDVCVNGDIDILTFHQRQGP